MWCILLARMRAPIAVSATSASTRMSRAAAPACAAKLAGKSLSLTLHVLAATNLVRFKWAPRYDCPYRRNGSLLWANLLTPCYTPIAHSNQNGISAAGPLEMRAALRC